MKTHFWDERGQGTAELLFVLLVLVLLLFGMVEIARGVSIRHALDVSTEKAARVLSINPADYDYATSLIRTEVNGSILGGGYGDRVVIQLRDAVSGAEISPADLATLGFGYRFVVEATVPWQPNIPFLSNPARTLSAMHFGIVESFP
ncbi:TadE/TadG family type IV pilus assembly protein [Thermogutta sp.]|uniref:TadE/TadG family type IV pilus assembly protein n=1 Tax=Thermogutta sp. TaxID=1962930 RepID=UPI0032207AD3